MNRLTQSGQLLYGIAIFSIGIIHIVTGNFPTGLLPISAAMPGRSLLVYAMGIVWLIAGGCVVVQKKAGFAAVWLGSLLLLLAGIAHLPNLIANPYDGGAWTAFAELAALAAGAFLTASNFPTDLPVAHQGRVVHQLARYGSLLYALSLLIFGILHVQYADYIATLIPAWIPGRLFWAYFIGVAFFATMTSILLNKQVPLAAILLGVMFLLWVILLHAPRVVTKLHIEPEWTSMFIALAMGGISFVLAGVALERSTEQTPNL